MESGKSVHAVNSGDPVVGSTVTSTDDVLSVSMSC